MDKLKEKIERKKAYISDINEQLRTIADKIDEIVLEKNELLEKQEEPRNDSRKIEIIKNMVKELNDTLSLLAGEQNSLNISLSRLREDLSKDIINLDIMIQESLEKESENPEFYEPTEEDLEVLKRQIENKYIEPANIPPELNPMNDDFDPDAFADEIEGL